MFFFMDSVDSRFDEIFLKMCQVQLAQYLQDKSDVFSGYKWWNVNIASITTKITFRPLTN